MKKKFLAFILSFILVFSLPLSAFARDSWTFTEKWNYFDENIYNLFCDVFGFCTDPSPDTMIKLNQSYYLLSQQKAVEDQMTYEEWFVSTHLFNMNEDNTKVESIELQPEALQVMNEVIVNFVNEQDNGYSYQTIYPASQIKADFFGSQTQYNAFINAINECPSDFVIVPSECFDRMSQRYWQYYNDDGTKNAGAMVGTGNNAKVFYYYTDSSGNPIDFYIYNNSGHIENYVTSVNLRLAYNWSNVRHPASDYFEGSWRGKIVFSNGTVKELSNPKHNTDKLFINSSSTMGYDNIYCNHIYTSKSYKQTVFVYDSINSIKDHDTGQAMPYYFSSNYKGGNTLYDSSQTINTSNMTDNNQTYNDIVNNIVNGMTGQEVIELVDTIMQNNKVPSGDGGGGGGSGDDDDSGGGIWGIIEKLVSGLFKLIGSLITGALDGITSILGSLGEVVSNLITVFTGGVIFEFLQVFLAWLPEPIPALLSTLFTISVIFAVIKLIKGALSK